MPGTGCVAESGSGALNECAEGCPYSISGSGHTGSSYGGQIAILPFRRLTSNLSFPIAKGNLPYHWSGRIPLGFLEITTGSNPSGHPESRQKSSRVSERRPWRAQFRSGPRWAASQVPGGPFKA
jgi:hypothetical protein